MPRMLTAGQIMSRVYQGVHTVIREVGTLGTANLPRDSGAVWQSNSKRHHSSETLESQRYEAHHMRELINTQSEAQIRYHLREFFFLINYLLLF